MRTRKQCAPPTSADMNGASTEVEGADLPGYTPHVSNVTPAIDGQKRRLIIVWRNGVLPMPPEQVNLTALQFAFLTHENRSLPRS